MKRWIPALLAGVFAATLSPVAIAAPAAAAEQSAAISVEGVVRRGVEANCLLLTPTYSQARTYLLLGGDRDLLRPGARVRVTGVLDPGAISFCMQGTALRVQSVTPLA